jgi:hypothetical protein
MNAETARHSLASRIEALRERREDHLRLGEKMLKAYEGTCYAMDFLGAAVLNRSIRLVKGFADVIADNFMCAAPLVRLQLDNLLRFHAAFLVENPHDFVMDVLRGERINRLKDRDNQQMTDRHLVEKAAVKHPQIRDIYDNGCSYVHLSEAHIFHAVQSSGDNQVCITISDEETEVTEGVRLAAIETMISLTDLVLKYVEGWTYTKDNPHLVTKPLQYADSLIQRRLTNEAREWLQRLINEHPDPTVVAKSEAMLRRL